MSPRRAAAAAATATAATAISLGFTPYPHQREAHKRRKRFTVLVWHRGAGKTIFAALELVGAALRLKDGRFAFLAPLLKQAKKAAWDALRLYTREIPGVLVNETELTIALPNGAKIMLLGADNPDALRGLHLDGVALDEVAQMKPQVWGEIVRPALSRKAGWAIFIGTPKGVNLFSELYNHALREMPVVGSDWYAELRRASESGVLSAAELAAAQKNMSAAQFAQEYECDFSAAVVDALIPLDVAMAATKRIFRDDEVEFAPKLIGVDVARYGDDLSSMARRHGPVLLDVPAWHGLNQMEVAARVAHAAAAWGDIDAIFVDVTGNSGAGVADRLRQLQFPVIDVQFGARAIDEQKYENKRAEMWSLMAEWLKTGQIPDDPALIQQLTGPTFSYANVRNRLQLESKDDMRARGLASPDQADALACSFAFPVAPRLPGELRWPSNNEICETEFDPFAALERRS